MGDLETLVAGVAAVVFLLGALFGIGLMIWLQ